MPYIKSDAKVSQKEWTMSTLKNVNLEAEIVENPEVRKQLIWKFINLAERHFAEHHQLDFYAQELRISKKSLNKLIINYIKKKPISILRELLVDELTKKLTITEIPMRELASKYGFKSPASFTRFIKSKTGFTPTKYRALMYINSN